MRSLLTALFLSLATALSAEVHEADIVVYGDASGGVVAAVQATRMGKSAILVSQYNHLGGLTSSGLGWTDIGNDATSAACPASSTTSFISTTSNPKLGTTKRETHSGTAARA